MRHLPSNLETSIWCVCMSVQYKLRPTQSTASPARDHQSSALSLSDWGCLCISYRKGLSSILVWYNMFISRENMNGFLSQNIWFQKPSSFLRMKLLKAFVKTKYEASFRRVTMYLINTKMKMWCRQIKVQLTPFFCLSKLPYFLVFLHNNVLIWLNPWLSMPYWNSESRAKNPAILVCDQV